MSEETKKSSHLLILDHEWHRIFDDLKNGKIKQLEKKLNQLLKNQAQLNEDLKAYKQVKKDLMKTIMDGMGEAQNDKKARKKLEKAKTQIDIVNKHLKQLELAMTDLPKEIHDTNQALLDESMAIYYKKIKTSKSDLDALAKEISDLRDQIKDKMLLKNDLDAKYQELYHYIHGLVGSEQIEIYDQKYLNE